MNGMKGKKTGSMIVNWDEGLECYFKVGGQEAPH